MGVTKQEASAEEIQQQQQESKAKEDIIGDDILSSLGFDEETQEEDQEDLDGQKIDLKNEIPAEEEEEEELEEGEENEESEEDEDEDMVPKSKFNKRLNNEVARRKILEAELEELKENQRQPETSNQQKLESMSVAELKELKVKAKAELRDLIRSGEDPDREAQVDNLIDEVSDAIRSEPTRFEKAQNDAYNKAADEIESSPDYESIDFTKHNKEITQIAASIYQKYPDLQKMKSGKGTALKLAVDHFIQTSSVKASKSKEANLKRKNTNLKRKTSLDTSSVKGQMSRAKLTKMRKAAKESPSFDKKSEFLSEFIDVDSYLPKAMR